MIFKHGKSIYVPNTSAEYGGSVSLNMHKMEHLKRQTFLVFLGSFFQVENHQIDWLVQERRSSIANALELRLSCTKPIEV